MIDMPARSLTLLFAFLLVFLSSQQAAARIWRIDAEGTGDAPTIQAAVDSAGSGDEIIVEPGTYRWSQQGHTGDYGMIYFARGVGGFALKGEGGPAVTILDGEHRGRLIYIQGYNDITIDGFSFVNGVAPGNYDAGGGLIGHLSSPVIRNCIFSANHAQQGGGLWYGGVSAPLIENCRFYGNNARYGGGICLVNSYSTGRIVGCVIRGNTADSRGGGIMTHNYRFIAEACAVCDNTAGESGGGISSEDPEISSMTLCTFSGNTSAEGGGIHLQGGASMGLSCSIIAFSGGGGALTMSTGSELNVESCVLWENYGGDSVPPGAAASRTIIIDPQFCAVAGSNSWMLQSDSPCLQPNHPIVFLCERIGAFGAGCGTVDTKKTSWGGIRKRYR